MTTFNGTKNDDFLPGPFGGSNGGDDTFYGNGGDDIIVGGAGKDAMYGGAGADTFAIDDEAEVVAGEIYSGGDGVDTIDVTLGADFRAAVIGADVEVLRAAGVGYAVDLTTAQFKQFQTIDSAGVIDLHGGGTVDMTGRSVRARVVRLEAATTLNLAGQTRAIEVQGSTGNDVITAGDADVFRLSGRGGNDILKGGAGRDSLEGGQGKDALNGGGGNDAFIIQSQSDLATGESLTGGTGIDAIVFDTISSFERAFNLAPLSIAADIERLSASNLNISLTAAQLGNFQSINANSIVVTTGGAVDLTDASIVLGAAGKIQLAAAGNSVDLSGVATGQTVVAKAGTNTIVGSDAGDDLQGAGGSDTLRGGAGADDLLGGRGKDTLDGGAGNDVFAVLSQLDLVAGETYAGGTGLDVLQIGGLGAAYNFSAITIGADVELLSGNENKVSLTTTQLENFRRIEYVPTLTLVNAGAAALAGATFDPDTVFNLNAAGNTLHLGGTSSRDAARSTHFTVNGGAGNDIITGGDGMGEATAQSALADDTLNGGGGDDTINGGAGNDFIYGGAGKDTMSGGANNDTLIIKSQAEIVAGEAYNGGAGIDTLDIRTTAATNLTAATISLIENLQSLGRVSLSAAQLGAFTNLDTGDITLTGSGVADLTNATIDTTTFYLNAAGNTLKLTGAGAHGYIVVGAAGRDNISGGDEGDYIAGGGNNDILTGGGGSDVFAYPVAASAGLDQILDFSGITSFGGTAGDGEGDVIGLGPTTGTFSYIQGAAFSGAGNAEARFAGNGTVQVDVNGNGASDFSVILKGMTSAGQLETGDFYVLP